MDRNSMNRVYTRGSQLALVSRVFAVISSQEFHDWLRGESFQLYLRGMISGEDIIAELAAFLIRGGVI